MNQAHLDLCASDDWANGLKQWIIPSALGGIELGNDVREIGPGPGRGTEILREMTPRLTAIELDAALAETLRERMAGTNVDVVHADATAMPFDTGRFSAAVSFIMLHHVPTTDLQDNLFAEVVRVLRPGGTFAGADSLDSAEFRALHIDDVCHPVAPNALEARLLTAGFAEAHVSVNPYVVEFRAKR